MTVKKAVFSATRWNLLAVLLRSGLLIVQTMVLARLLTPTDFGLMAMAGVPLSIALLFSDLGLSSALMHRNLPDVSTLSTLFWLNFGIASTLALAFGLFGNAIAMVFGEPKLEPVMLLLALCFPLGALGQQFRVLAEKSLCFKVLAQNEVVSTCAGFSIAMLSAMHGFGVYAFVTAQLVSISVNSLLAWIRLSKGLRPSITFNWDSAQPFVTFGLYRMGDSLWNSLLLQTDVFIAGLIASSHSLAFYTTPRDQCLKLANLLINPVITRVGLPLMTSLKENPAALREVYSKTLQLTASFNFPFYAYLGIFSDQIVVLLLGNQWQEAATFLRIFALWGFFRSTGNPAGSLIYAVGMAKRAHFWSFSLFVATVPIYWVAAKLGGLSSLAWSMAAWHSVIFVLAWRFIVRPSCGIRIVEYVTNFIPPLVATFLASAVAYMSSNLCPTSMRFYTGTLIFGCAYLSVSWWLNKPFLMTIYELASPFWGRR